MELVINCGCKYVSRKSEKAVHIKYKLIVNTKLVPFYRLRIQIRKKKKGLPYGIVTLKKFANV